MTTQTLTSVALHVVDQYNDAGKHLVAAWRHGARRAIGAVGSAASRYDAFWGERPMPLVSEEMKAGLSNAHRTVTGFLVNRLERDTDRLTGVMDRIAERTASGIQSVSQVAERAEQAFNLKASEPLRALNMPLAQVASRIADTVAKGARKLEQRVQTGHGEADATVTTVTPKATRRTRKA